MPIVVQLPVEVDVTELSLKWRTIVCAVEGISAASCMQTDPTSKRAISSLANGHGIAGIIDESLNYSDNNESSAIEAEEEVLLSKKKQRAQWWQSIIAGVVSVRRGVVLFPSSYPKSHR